MVGWHDHHDLLSGGNYRAALALIEHSPHIRRATLPMVVSYGEPERGVVSKVSSFCSTHAFASVADV
ncbi:MAG TPA: hypothetical protein VGD58_27410 [Herpetosiphonaceae bacterium]